MEWVQVFTVYGPLGTLFGLMIYLGQDFYRSIYKPGKLKDIENRNAESMAHRNYIETAAGQQVVLSQSLQSVAHTNQKIEEGISRQETNQKEMYDLLKVLMDYLIPRVESRGASTSPQDSTVQAQEKKDG